MKKVFSLHLLLCITASLSVLTNLQGFSSLPEAIALADSLQEFPQVENQDIFNPRYTLYNKRRLAQEQSLINRMLNLVGLKKNTWNNQLFIDLLKKVTAQRSCAKMNGTFIQKLTIPAGTKLIFFGNLHGAFHSLVRDLSHLKDWGIIDDHFVIQKNTFYMIINGNAIDRSAYNVETLCILLNLLKANPDKVLYVRGSHEFGRWVDYDLKAELQIRMQRYSSEEIPLKKELDAFFATLPLALYVKYGTGDSAQFIRFSQLKDTGSDLDANGSSPFLLRDDDKISDIYHIESNATKHQEVKLMAFFKEGLTGNQLFYDRGLSYMVPENTTANWNLLSCPTQAYRSTFNLVHDSFAIIDAQADMNSWTITHYSQNALKQEPLFANIYDMVTGSKLYNTHFPFGMKSELITSKNIFSLTNDTTKIPAFYIGATLDFTLLAQYGHEQYQGFSARINQENLRGGINKQLLKFFCLNDSYSLLQAEINTKELIQRGIDTHVMLFGSQTFLDLRPLIEQKNAIFLFPEAGIAAAREKSLTNMVHFLAAYNDEAPILIHQALDVLKLRKLAIFYQDDAYGKESLYAAEQLFKKRNFTNYITISYTRGSIDIKASSEKLARFTPDGLILFSTPLSTINLIHEMGISKTSKLVMMGVHILGLPEFDNFIKNKGLKIILTQVTPNPFDTSLPIVAAYQNDMRAEGYTKFSNFSLLSYIHATLLVEVLKKIRGPITKEKIMAGFESLKNFDLGGISLNFNPETRSLGSHVWLVQDGKWQHFNEPPKEPQEAVA